MKRIYSRRDDVVLGNDGHSGVQTRPQTSRIQLAHTQEMLQSKPRLAMRHIHLDLPLPVIAIQHHDLEWIKRWFRQRSRARGSSNRYHSNARTTNTPRRRDVHRPPDNSRCTMDMIRWRTAISAIGGNPAAGIQRTGRPGAASAALVEGTSCVGGALSGAIRLARAVGLIGSGGGGSSSWSGGGGVLGGFGEVTGAAVGAGALEDLVQAVLEQHLGDVDHLWLACGAHWRSLSPSKGLIPCS